MIRRILVPLDGSSLANSVLAHVEELARRLNAEVCFVQVVGVQMKTASMQADAAALLSPEFMADELEAEASAAETRLSSVTNDWRAKGIDAKWEIIQEIVGRAPGPSIVGCARAHDIDLIAMATHGRSGIGRLIMGSVADEVMREAGMPVLLLRGTQKGQLKWSVCCLDLVCHAGRQTRSSKRQR